MRRLTLSALLAFALLSLGVPAPGADAAKRLITPEDLLKFAFVSNATISHDGKLVAFAVKRADLKETAITPTSGLRPRTAHRSRS